MTPVLTMGLPLLAGLALALVAGRRGWAPPLWVALGVGTVLRLVLMAVAAQDPVQAYDFDQDFRQAADTVLDGRNPAMHMREGGWHFLPLLAYVLAAQRELGELLGLSWNVVGRIVPVLADLALIPLVAKLATERRSLRAFQYACAPLGIMVSSVHGQFPPLTLLLGVAALVAARGNRVHLAGLLIGLSVTCTNWSALLIPGVLLAVPGVRNRLAVLGWTAAVPAVFLLSSTVVLDTRIEQLPDLVRAILSTRPVAGDWGWTALATGGIQTVSPVLGQIGMPVLVIGLLAAGWWWRRADPVDLTLVLLLVFLIVTYRLGAQYLMWPMPYLIARVTRGTWPAVITAGLWAAVGYLRPYELLGVGWWHAHIWWAFSSFLVIPFLILALPWQRRIAPAAPEAGPAASPEERPPASMRS
ncbi:hypothetical protein [Streptosporangium sp. KLBMP 9127]|nr:hypothetical protein [Streptosporangium sp. KLBMP 9127]